MGEDTMPREETQADFIQKELNFDINPDDTVTKASLDQPEEEWMDILGNGQLKKKCIKRGFEETRPNRGDVCLLDITCQLTDGTVVERMDNFSIQLGDMEVVQGLDLAIALMDLYEVAKIIVDPRFGYGKHGSKSIPPNAVITYTVELKEIVPEPEIHTLSLNKRREIGMKKRERGNWWFLRGEPTIAIQCYRKALKYLADDYYINTKDSTNQNKKYEPVSDEVLQSMFEDCMKVHNNLGASLIKTGAYDTALEHVEIVLLHQPQNEKALYRKARALRGKGEYIKAYAIFAEAHKINPDNAIINAELIDLKEKIARNTEKERSLCRKMLGIGKKSTDSSKNAKIQDKSKIAKGLLWTLVGGASAAVIGILIHRFAS